MTPEKPRRISGAEPAARAPDSVALATAAVLMAAARAPDSVALATAAVLMAAARAPDSVALATAARLFLYHRGWS